MAFCKAYFCRFSLSHTTKFHQCGNCGAFGHGQMECKDINEQEKLREFHNEILEEDLWCSYCSYSNEDKKYHTDDAHICEKCGDRHSEYECIIQELGYYKRRFTDIAELMCFSENMFKDYVDDDGVMNNIYTMIYTGMGSQLYINRKNNEISALFMDQDSWGQYGQHYDNSKKLVKFCESCQAIDKEKFIVLVNRYEEEKEYDCPICRTSNPSSEIKKAYGIEDKCKLCLDNSVTRFFSVCGHAVSCDDCFEKL